MSVGTAGQPFLPKSNHSSLSFCLTNICHLHLLGVCACVCVRVCFVMSSVGFLTPWDWSDPELSDLCLFSTYTHSDTDTHTHTHTRTNKLCKQVKIQCSSMPSLLKIYKPTSPRHQCSNLCLPQQHHKNGTTLASYHTHTDTHTRTYRLGWICSLATENRVSD